MSFRHGDRVRVGGFQGPAGVLYRCEKRDRSGHYFKVNLASGQWVWPDRLVVDSRGIYTERCRECDGEFHTDRLGEPLCPNCDRRGRPNQDTEHTRKIGATLRGSRGYGVASRRPERSTVASHDVPDDDIPF